MRQIGSLTQQRDAQRFAAYLVTLGIDAHAEQDYADWMIWVRDENQINQAKKEYELFRLDPTDSRYRGAEREAESLRREVVQQRVAAQKNVIEMRGRWQSMTSQQAPLTITLIALSVLVTLFGSFGHAEKGFGATINEQLYFVSLEDYAESEGNTLASIAKGELWRTITPVFIHLDIIHLLFNMIMFYQFGRLLESLRGTMWFAVAVLVIAIVSSMAQGVLPEALGGSVALDGKLIRFGGMSGVVYGLFGYAWVKSWLDPQSGIYLSPMTVAILMGWLVLCIVAMDNVANAAHVVGLVVGAAFGYLPILLRR